MPDSTAQIIKGERIARQGQLAIGCSAAVFDGSHQHILLIRRSDTGQWAVPGGYMEAGESLVVLHFEAKPISGDLSVSNESSEVKFFSQAEIPSLAIGPFDRMRIMDAFVAQEAAFIRDEF